ncbi:MAG: methionine ABC transporter permease [Actinomycetaceae bacterium]|nr:methionine ABC transporter permease [Actinomycetaceae bacterium]
MDNLALASAQAGHPLPTGPGDPTWGDNPAITREMLPATLQTLGTTLLSGFFTILLGLPLGLLLVALGPKGLLENRTVFQVVSFIVNVVRSFPFIILVIWIAPFTRLVTGTSLGWKAACVPLVIGAVPFFARLVETNILSVDEGKIEAAKMMGARRAQIMWGVQVREVLPALIQSTTVLIITLIGYSAITGTLGGGGLGQMAMNYGYNRYQSDTMLVAVVLFVVIVQVFQMVGDMLSRLVDHR